MRICLTGIAGFIGYHLAHYLKKKGCEVMGLDSFHPYYSVALKEKRAHMLEKEGIKIEKVDIAQKIELLSCIEKFGPTHIVHLAAQAGVRFGAKDPDSYIESNLRGFVNILEVVRKYPHIPFIYASSSSVYGEQKQKPFVEDLCTDFPTSLYAATKKSGELLAYAYHRMYGIKSTGLRFFTVYGPWGRPDMAYFSFAQKIMKEEKIQLFNEGDMHRDFTYIEDIVSGISTCIEKSFDWEIFNLGNSKPVSLLYFVQLLEKYLGKKAHLTFSKAPLGEMPLTYADIRKSQDKLNIQGSAT